jgi:RHS repeat-associated protein
MSVPGQPTVNYAYDTANRVTSITQGLTTVGFGYDNADRRNSLTLPNGILIEAGYDEASHLTSLTYKRGTTVLGNLTYEYDSMGRRTRTGGSFARQVAPAQMTSANYDDANQMVQRESTSLTYDANGNLTNDGVNTYNWNARGQLASITGPGLSASFQYDSFGRRTAKTINGQTTKYLYDLANIVQERAADNSVLANLLMGGIDEVFQRTDATGPRSFLTDSLGSTLALTDENGAIQTEYSYDPFGTTQQSGASSSNSYQFTGRENDGTGLQYNRARYYSPRLQRFISEDPIGLGGGINSFAYVANSPTNFRDPSGKVLDTIADVVFIAWDIYDLVTGGWKNLGTNLLALGLDIIGLCIPFVTGLGRGYKIANKIASHSDDIVKLTNRADDVVDTGRKLPIHPQHTNCFVAGTLVHTKEGVKPIEEIKAGDEVLSYNEETKQVEYKPVVQTFVNYSPEILSVYIEGESKPIETTPGHPFYVYFTRL